MTGTLTGAREHAAIATQGFGWKDGTGGRRTWSLVALDVDCACIFETGCTRRQLSVGSLSLPYPMNYDSSGAGATSEHTGGCCRCIIKHVHF